MNYNEFIAKALRGRSTNRAAKELGVPQSTLDKYVRGVRVPDYCTAVKLAKEADVSLGETMLILMEKEASKKAISETLATGFRLLTDAKKRLFKGTFVFA